MHVRRLVEHNSTMTQDSANASPQSIRSHDRIAEKFALRTLRHTLLRQLSLSNRILCMCSSSITLSRLSLVTETKNERATTAMNVVDLSCHVAGINCSANGRRGRECRLAVHLGRERLDSAMFRTIVR